MARSGAACRNLPKCRFFDELLFIKDTVSNRPSCSNISLYDIPPVSSSQEDGVSSKRCSTEPTPRKRAKKISLADTANECIIEALSKNDDQKEIDADVSFANSIVPILRNLPPIKNRMAKIEIQKVLFKYEFDLEIEE